ncbi:hypothetical protein ACFFX0_25290 [Citricoccus parietis]|uniref:Uncharacterized protein n=1 Tax=Citricoccus parietis TaxID=592307 RepID=A0ABV5G5W0_9MICC
MRQPGQHSPKWPLLLPETGGQRRQPAASPCIPASSPRPQRPGLELVGPRPGPIVPAQNWSRTRAAWPVPAREWIGVTVQRSVTSPRPGSQQ